MKPINAIAAGLVLMTGCSDGGADSDGDGGISREELRAEMAGGSPVNLTPGKYEQTMTLAELDVPGMPKEARDMMKGQMGRTIKITTCLTPDQAAKPDAQFFSGEGNDDCTYQEFDRSGNRMKLRMTCKSGQGGEARIAMQGEFNADSYALEMQSTVSGAPDGNVTMKGMINAKRIGDCG